MRKCGHFIVLFSDSLLSSRGQSFFTLSINVLYFIHNLSMRKCGPLIVLFRLVSWVVEDNLFTHWVSMFFILFITSVWGKFRTHPCPVSLIVFEYSLSYPFRHFLLIFLCLLNLSMRNYRVITNSGISDSFLSSRGQPFHTLRINVSYFYF